MVDIKLSDEWQLTAAATGDAPVTSDTEGFIQTIKIEALTQEGELFYDEDFGWSLMDFIHCEETDLNKIEIESRISEKLSKYEEIKRNTIFVSQEWSNDTINITVEFVLVDGTDQEIVINLDRVEVSVE